MTLITDAFVNDFSYATVAPAVRSCIRPCPHPVVTFLGDPSFSDPSIAGRVGLHSVTIAGCRTVSSVFDQLRRLKTQGCTADLVLVENIGSFLVAPTKETCFKKLRALQTADPYVDGAGDSLAHTRLSGRVIAVTGGAQGFGREIGMILAKNGAQVIFADVNLPKAQDAAEQANQLTSAANARAVYCDVSSESSVRHMCQSIAREYGGMDVMCSNAGICSAGSLEQLSAETFEKVTSINYTGFFLVCKYASRSMKIQQLFDENFFGDIIQTNSKAGLKGWLNNSAYCGSKFGGIGLVQSLSRELIRYRIKINAVCPGNYYEGPLWSDPDHGLFVQYFNAGKVDGAQSPADVRDWYFSQEIFGRGCTPADVATAIMYCIEQQYETGQAIPVAGGLEMLP